MMDSETEKLHKLIDLEYAIRKVLVDCGIRHENISSAAKEVMEEINKWAEERDKKDDG